LDQDRLFYRVESFHDFLPIRPIRPIRPKQFRNTLDGYPVLAAVRMQIPEGSKPLAGGQRSATSG